MYYMSPYGQYLCNSNHQTLKFLIMKQLLIMLLLTVAFVIICPFVFIYCLWDFNFSTVRGLRRDYLETMSYPIYQLFHYKTKHYRRVPGRF